MEGWALKLVEDTGMSFFETPMGKVRSLSFLALFFLLNAELTFFSLSSSTSSLTLFLLAFFSVGSNSFPAVQALVEKSDLVISLGAIISDFNSGSFSWGINKNILVELHSDHMKVG